MLHIEVTRDWFFVGCMAALGSVLASLYAVFLSTGLGRRLCRRRTHWTVVCGHLIMALTMGFVSWELAGLWLFWSAAHGLPLIVRSELDRLRDEERRGEVVAAAVRGALRGEDDEGERTAGVDRGGGDGRGSGGAGG